MLYDEVELKELETFGTYLTGARERTGSIIGLKEA